MWFDFSIIIAITKDSARRKRPTLNGWINTPKQYIEPEKATLPTVTGADTLTESC